MAGLPFLSPPHDSLLELRAGNFVHFAVDRDLEDLFERPDLGGVRWITCCLARVGRCAASYVLSAY